MVGADAQIQKNISELSVNDATNGGPAPLDMRPPDYGADDDYFAKAMPGRGRPHLSKNGSRLQTVTDYVQENISFLKGRVLLVGGLRWFNPSGTRTVRLLPSRPNTAWGTTVTPRISEARKPAL